MSLNGKLTKATSESLLSQVIMRDNFSPKGSFTLNCFHLGAFRKNTGQLKRRYGNIYMNKCIFKINNIFPTKFEIKMLYARKYQLRGYP